MSKRHKILVVDKFDKYSYLFSGFRKNKFVHNKLVSLLRLSDAELCDISLLFMVLYEPRDVFELLKVCKSDTPLIIASENVKILKKLKDLECFIVLDLSNKGNLYIGFHECISKVFVLC